MHTRHGRTRYEQWLTITPEQLRIAPPLEVCRELLTHTPESRKVRDTLTVSFKGREYDVRSVPSVMVGESLQIALNPYALDTAVVVDTDEDGQEVLHSIPLVARNDAGFRDDANVIGEDWARPADTALDANRKEIERYAMDAGTDAEAEAKRKAKALPFGGRIDPFKVVDQAPERTYLPKRGTDLATSTTTRQAPASVLSVFEAAAELVRMGVQMSRETSAQLRAWYPDGVPEDQLNDVRNRLTVRSGLRVVAGGGA